ncbi:MAG: hypothetical protein ACI3XQ_09655, partial [Eubacteriales bacterium]
YLMSQISSAMGILYSKDMYESLKYEDDLYELVKNKEWTLEKLNLMTQDVYQDLNNSATVDDADRFGFYGNGHSINGLLYGFDCPVTNYLDDGSVSIANYYNEHLVSVFDNLYRFFNDNNNVIRGGDSDNLVAVSSGKTLFASTWIDTLISERMRNSADRIGILPNPLFDTEQEEYYSYMQRWDLMYIPTNADFERSTIVLEYLNFTSAEYMVPRYWETSLSLKGADEEADKEMLQIIRDSLFYDFVMVFNTEMGGMKDAVAFLISSRSNSLSSWWQQNEKKYSESLEILQMFYE